MDVTAAKEGTQAQAINEKAEVSATDRKRCRDEHRRVELSIVPRQCVVYSDRGAFHGPAPDRIALCANATLIVSGCSCGLDFQPVDVLSIADTNNALLQLLLLQ